MGVKAQNKRSRGCAAGAGLRWRRSVLCSNSSVAGLIVKSEKAERRFSLLDAGVGFYCKISRWICGIDANSYIDSLV